MHLWAALEICIVQLMNDGRYRGKDTNEMLKRAVAMARRKAMKRLSLTAFLDELIKIDTGRLEKLCNLLLD